MAAAHAMLTNETLMALVVGYQHGLLYTFVPHFKRWQRVHLRWKELIKLHRRRTVAQEAMTFQCTCLYTPSELCLATLSGPAVCLEYEKAYHAHVAIRNGDLEALTGWLSYCPTLATPQAITCAARYGSLECLEKLLNFCETTPVQALEYAVEKGHLHIVQRLYLCYQVNQLINEGEFNLLDVAAATGHLPIVEFLHNAGYPRECTTKAMDTASANGHLPVVEFLHNYRNEGATSAAIDGAAANGHLDVVIYLHTTRHDEATKSAMDIAAARGYLNIVMYLNENRSEGCGSHALDDASKAGHLDVVKYLHFNVHSKPLCTFRAMNNAALNGHLDIIKFLHDNRTEGCTTFAMDWAASKGFLDIVDFLHTNRTEGCTTKAMNGAAKCGYLDVVQYLHNNRSEGCTTEAIDCAAANGHYNVVEFLVCHRQEGFTCRAIRRAAERKDAAMLQLLWSAFPGLRQGSIIEFCQAELEFAELPQNTTVL